MHYSITKVFVDLMIMLFFHVNIKVQFSTDAKVIFFLNKVSKPGTKPVQHENLTSHRIKPAIQF